MFELSILMCLVEFFEYHNTESKPALENFISRLKNESISKYKQERDKKFIEYCLQCDHATKIYYDQLHEEKENRYKELSESEKEYSTELYEIINNYYEDKYENKKKMLAIEYNNKYLQHMLEFVEEIISQTKNKYDDKYCFNIDMLDRIKILKNEIVEQKQIEKETAPAPS